MLTHTSMDLQAPDFVPSERITDKGKFGAYSYNDTVSTNIAMLKLVAKWMDYLKQNGCYDNTRIIIVADHGAGRDGPAEFFTEKNSIDGYGLDQNHPLLMVKDFAGARGSDKNGGREFTVDNSFMTNADTPSLAFEGIIKKPVNPWTGKEITKRKESAAYGVVAGAPYDPGKHGLYKFDLNGIKTYDVFDDMSKASNWKERKE